MHNVITTTNNKLSSIAPKSFITKFRGASTCRRNDYYKDFFLINERVTLEKNDFVKSANILLKLHFVCRLLEKTYYLPGKYFNEVLNTSLHIL